MIGYTYRSKEPVKRKSFSFRQKNRGWLGGAVKDAVSNMISTETQRMDESWGASGQIGYSFFQGMFIGLGIEVIAQFFNEEKIDIKSILLRGAAVGADFSVKTGAAHILKDFVRGGFMSFIPETASIVTLSNISYIIVEDIKSAGRSFMTGGNFDSFLKKIKRTTLITIIAIVSSNEGISIGIEVGSRFGKMGGGVIGFIAGTLGYVIGFKAADMFIRAADIIKKKERDIRMGVVGSVIDVLKEACREAKNLL